MLIFIVKNIYFTLNIPALTKKLRYLCRLIAIKSDELKFL